MDLAFDVQIKIHKYKMFSAFEWTITTVSNYNGQQYCYYRPGVRSQPKSKNCTVKLDLYPFSPHVSTQSLHSDELLGSVFTTNVSGPLHFYMPVTHRLTGRSDPERNPVR